MTAIGFTGGGIRVPLQKAMHKTAAEEARVGFCIPIQYIVMVSKCKPAPGLNSRLLGL